jgi:hypothetical protein
VISSAIARAIKYIRAWDKAWTWAATRTVLDPRPPEGAYVVIGCRSPGEAIGGIEHALTVVQWLGDTMVSVDGEQDDRGLQCIRVRERTWELDDVGRLRVRDPASGAWRRVLGWGDPARMRYQGDTCHVPAGWEREDHE